MTTFGAEGIIVETAASATALTAVGIYREARKVRRSVSANRRRSKAADTRSRGNRQMLRALGRKVWDRETYQPPREFDPDTEARDG